MALKKYQCQYCKSEFDEVSETHILQEGRLGGYKRRINYTSSRVYYLVVCDQSQCLARHQSAAQPTRIGTR